MIAATALWRRLDVAGHDAARLEKHRAGWTVSGLAVFQHEDGPAALAYEVQCGRDWRSRRGAVRGCVGRKRIAFEIAREADEWSVNGKPGRGLGGLFDLDFGFTPATNLQQLRRVPIEIGETADIPVAWFDVETGRLTPLPQRYARRSETAYDYTAPSVGYRGLLEIAPSGFVRVYPKLWRLEEG